MIARRIALRAYLAQATSLAALARSVRADPQHVHGVLGALPHGGPLLTLAVRVNANASIVLSSQSGPFAVPIRVIYFVEVIRAERLHASACVRWICRILPELCKWLLSEWTVLQARVYDRLVRVEYRQSGTGATIHVNARTC